MESLTLSLQLPVPAEMVYSAWISSTGHRDFTGGNAVIEARNGGHYSAWDGYITGIMLKLEPGHRIVQSWRTTDFHPMDPSSTVEVLLEDNDNGCLLTINHTEIPNGQAQMYETGWKDNYFEPMMGYFTIMAEDLKINKPKEQIDGSPEPK
jgi:uncharacterized protein YndB with AHSA1/START domain